jgi:hypothetical protein
MAAKKKTAGKSAATKKLTAAGPAIKKRISALEKTSKELQLGIQQLKSDCEAFFGVHGCQPYPKTSAKKGS